MRDMETQSIPDLFVDDVEIDGHTRPITLRSYRPRSSAKTVPIVVYFHGGAFIGGSLDDADTAASTIAVSTPAWVVSVGYSLAPEYPFPTAPEDGYRALIWATRHARAHRADGRRIGLAGHDAGGNLATSVAAIARDRGEVIVSAQALLAPLLDPSMTRLANGNGADNLDLTACASCYRAYLPIAIQRIHPYAAPLESRRLQGLPSAHIASVQNDQLHIEAERYGSELIAAGVPTEVIRYANTSHADLSTHAAALADVTEFFQRRLDRQIPKRK